MDEKPKVRFGRKRKHHLPIMLTLDELRTIERAAARDKRPPSVFVRWHILTAIEQVERMEAQQKDARQRKRLGLEPQEEGTHVGSDKPT